MTAPQPSRADRYLTQLDAMAGGVEPEFWSLDPVPGEPKSVTAIGYRDLPEDGLLLGFTYGLSLAEHPAWVAGKPELSICARSDDPAWVVGMAVVAQSFRGDCPFSYGDLLDVGEPIAPGSELDGFVVFAPVALEPDAARIDVGEDRPVIVAGMYPTYAREREFIQERGLEAFWQLPWDAYDVNRPPAV